MLKLEAGSVDLAFVDVETTGVDDYDHIWEIAVIRCRPDGMITRVMHEQVRHRQYLAAGLPPEFQADHALRYRDEIAISPANAAEQVRRVLNGTTMVGVNPAFDSRMLGQLVEGQGYSVTWDYRVIDLAAMSLPALEILGQAVKLPWKSDDLARAVGVSDLDPVGQPWERHTAMGDVQWAIAWWEQLTGIPVHHHVYDAAERRRTNRRVIREDPQPYSRGGLVGEGQQVVNDSGQPIRVDTATRSTSTPEATADEERHYRSVEEYSRFLMSRDDH